MKSGSLTEIDALLTRYVSNKCTPEEKHRLYELLVSADMSSVTEILSSHLDEFNENQFEDGKFDSESVYRKLMARLDKIESTEVETRLIQRKERFRRLLFRAASAAAIFFFAFFLGIKYYSIKPGSAASETNTSEFTLVKAPLGARSEVTLPDGTEIILNAGSSIKYKSDYSITHRNIVLEGEGYFRVAKNSELPLIVYAGSINIRATGTEFNVKAYADEDIIETTLVNGEVEISQAGNDDHSRMLKLEPNQKAIYVRQSDRLTLEKIKEIEPLAVKPAKVVMEDLMVSSKPDVDQEIAWTKHKLIIRKENLESLCTKLARKYDVIFEFRDEDIKKHRFTGVLLDETFEQIMDAIMLVAPIDYSFEGKTVYLFSKKDMTTGTKHSH